MKAKLLMEIVIAGKEITRETLISSHIQLYKADKLAVIRKTMKPSTANLLEEEGEEYILERYKPKKKKSDEPKKTTLEETLELWQQKMSVEDIAHTRKLTKTTVLGHLAKLIEAGLVQLNDVLPQDKVDSLSKAFDGYTEDSLNPLKEKYGDTFSWDELKLFKAGLKNRN